MFGFKKKVLKDTSFVSAVIVAGGSSTRFGENKLLMQIQNMTVIEKTLQIFDSCDEIDEIILVCRQEDLLTFSKYSEYLKTSIKIVNGGKTRTHSTYNGLKECNKNATIIAIHDGARPLITHDVIKRAVENTKEFDATVPVVASKDTMKIVCDNKCVKSIDRNTLFAIQTPQVFKADIIKNALKRAFEENLDFTDDTTVVEYFGTEVTTVLGDYDNIKITTIEDISLANLIVERRGY